MYERCELRAESIEARVGEPSRQPLFAHNHRSQDLREDMVVLCLFSRAVEGQEVDHIGSEGWADYQSKGRMYAWIRERSRWTIRDRGMMIGRHGMMIRYKDWIAEINR